MSVIARLEHVTKTYRLGTERSNWRALIPGPRGETTGKHSFTALDDVSLEIGAGRAVGVVGPNGAGKSTLIKVLAGVVRPSSGRVTVTGRVAPVIELGIGFNPDLSGADNLRFGGLLLGIDSVELANKYSEIVEFAGLGDFMDMPVKRYSTGMKARLGFALVSAFEFDLILLDEVLSVGDWSFQRRSLDRLRERHREGAALVIVSHSHWMMGQISDEAILLDHGSVAASGDPLKVISQYIGEESDTDPTRDPRLPRLTDLAQLTSTSPIRVFGLTVEPPSILPNDPLEFHFRLDVPTPVNAELVLSIYTMGRAVLADSEVGPSELLQRAGTHHVRGRIEHLPFAAGAFQLRVAVVENQDPDDSLQEHAGALASDSVSFNVSGSTSTRPGLHLGIVWESQSDVAPRPTRIER